jgi:hypothetical protein
VEENKLLWHAYFESIKEVCPWSWSAVKQQAIDFQPWHSQVQDLGEYSARVYTAPRHNPRQLQKIAARLTAARTLEEWLWSHPKLGEHSTPVGVLIQQDAKTLEIIRNKLQLHK